MTVSFSIRKSGPYTATLGETVFNYGFPITSANQLEVWRRRGGAELKLQLNNHYTVTGVGNDQGGTVVLSSGALEGDEYTILGAKALERTGQFPGWRSIPPGAIDAELNSLQIQIQEIRRDLARCLAPSPTQVFSGALPDPMAGRLLGWNPAGDALQNIAPGGHDWRGAWVLGETYSAGDMVQNHGSSYIAIAGHLSSSDTEPGAGGDWESVWSLFAARGSDGDPGPGGPGSGDLLAANNLSDLANIATARDNLGLGALATLNAVSTNEIANDAVTWAKLQNVSATDRLLARVSAGAGNIEEAPFTDLAQGLLAQATEGALKAYLNIEAGVDVQAWSATLDTWATKTPPTGDPVGTSDAQTLTAKVIDAAQNTLSNLAVAMFAANVVDTDTMLAANSDARLASQRAIKAYIDNAVTGLKWKPAVAVATTGNIALSGLQTIDGVLLDAGDRVLVKDQTDLAENGIYVVAGGAWSRAADADTGAELVAAAVLVMQGTSQNTTQWTCSNSAITLGSTAIAFVQMAGAGTYSAAGGLQLASNQFSIADNGVTFAKLQDIATDRLIGRDAAGSGDAVEIAVTGGIEFDGANQIRTTAFTGDVTKTAGGTTLTIANDVVTFAKMANMNTDRLIGRDTAGTGDPEEISVGGGLEFTGLGGIRRSALTGDVTAAAGSNATTIADAAVTFAKLQSINSDRLIGRDAASVGAATEISVGGGLEFTGANALQVGGFTGDVTKAGGSTTLTIANDTVTLAKMADIATARLLGRVTAGTGDPEALTGTQATTLLDVFQQDLKGLVPAPTAADIAGLRFLRADGTWVVPAGGGGGLGDGDYGDITVAEGGSSITVNARAITNAKLANMAEARLKGRAAGAGTGDPADLTAAQVLALLGALSVVNMQVFTTPGEQTYTPTTGMRYCLVMATGGGGGGGGADGSSGSRGAGGGGGGGGTAIDLYSAATIGANKTVTIGSGGSGGSTEGSDGTAGGNTTFGALLTGGGGPGGIGVSSPSTQKWVDEVAGGTASGGRLNLPGGMGGPGVGFLAQNNTSVVISGIGGGSLWGDGAGAIGGISGGNNTRDGVAAKVPGAGGSGASNIANTSGQTGGAGADGICVVIEFA